MTGALQGLNILRTILEQTPAKSPKPDEGRVLKKKSGLGGVTVQGLGFIGS